MSRDHDQGQHPLHASEIDDKQDRPLPHTFTPQSQASEHGRLLPTPPVAGGTHSSSQLHRKDDERQPMSKPPVSATDSHPRVCCRTSGPPSTSWLSAAQCTATPPPLRHDPLNDPEQRH
ncbi:hypothetical protein WJX73_000246 [Symbiochloris irregularis]|uniref:Uncharacterized protein n=1 Tax=Symbiochloris irregularis TaxID=706552 RepID=A0AAW1NTU7_9CHLO